jgi:hypothetical protein
MNRKKLARTASIFVAVAASVLADSAYALRCGSRVITRGDHATKVLNFCGEPVHVQSRVVVRAILGRLNPGFSAGLNEEVLIEEWTYNFGPYRLMTVIELENGVVSYIRYLGYGYSSY